MLKMDVEHCSSHFTSSAVALPGTNSVMEYSLGCIKALFITKAMPAEAHGFSGSGEFIISRFFPKHD